jgi:hypothetical protein
MPRNTLALTAIGSGLNNTNTIQSNLTTNSLFGADHKIATILRAPRAGTLYSFGIKFGATMVQAPANGLRFSFQSVNSAGNADETVDEFRVVTTAFDGSAFGVNKWTEPVDPMTDDGTDTGVKRIVAAGESFACVVDFASFLSGDSITLTQLNNTTGGFYRRQTTAGSTWTGVNSPLCFSLKYDDGYEYVGDGYFPVMTADTIQWTSTADTEYGLRFILPVRAEFRGFQSFIGMASFSNNIRIRLYDATGAVLEEQNGPSGLAVGLLNNTAYCTVWMGPIVLEPNVEYIVGIKPTSGGNNFSIRSFTAPDNDHLDCVVGGKEYYLASRVTDAGAFTYSTTMRPLWSLLLNSTGIGAGGESSSVFG